MPYEWSPKKIGSDEIRLELWPHRSLPRRGFSGFMAITAVLISIPLFPLIGTALLWGLLPFLMMAVAGLWWALQRSYNNGNTHEALTIDPNEVHLIRTNPKGELQEWECNSYWAQVTLHASGGPVSNYVTLKGKGREVEIGAFLSDDERKSLFSEISNALKRARAS